ncbi:Flagellar hook-length control protein FliK [Actinokineospora spheciospongiae]|uniref:Flagellar hook-length control protein FliK n=1 Tax=Actinokineospora spheciospongiae TaxID=909613 RepID=W7IRF1_9PSEU|nr:Flagellar hook-length control protein FliK [Actinokineospora spheciospongiae]
MNSDSTPDPAATSSPTTSGPAIPPSRPKPVHQATPAPRTAVGNVAVASPITRICVPVVPSPTTATSTGTTAAGGCEPMRSMPAPPSPKQPATTRRGPNRSASGEASSAPTTAPPLSTSSSTSDPREPNPDRPISSGSHVLSANTSSSPIPLTTPSSTAGSSVGPVNNPANPDRPRSRPRHAGDSGSRHHASGSNTTSGSAPIQNSPRQPIVSNRDSAATVPRTLPSGMPQ